MNVEERIQAAIRRLAAERPVDQVTLADVARLAEVHWTTVRRHVGGKAGLKALVEGERPATVATGPDTRSRILAAAAQIFGEQGFAGASLDDVAGAAQLTKGAVYWHFASKSDLFLALVEENTRQQLATWPEEAEAVLRGPDPVAALAVWLGAAFAGCQRDPGQVRLYLEFITSSRDEPVQTRLAAVHRSARRGAAEALRRLQEQGLISVQLNPQVLAVFVQALMNGLTLEWLVDPEEIRLQDWAPEIAALLWRGAEPKV